MTAKALDLLARTAFEQAMAHYGVHPRGKHRWENQDDELKASWRAVVRAVLDKAKELADGK